MAFERLKDKITRNVGGAKDIIYYCETKDILVEAIAPDLTPTSVDNNVANIAARDAIAAPVADDTAFVVSTDEYYIYTTEWVLLQPNTITASHTFAADRGFQRLQGTEGKVKVDIDPATEKDVTGTGIKATIGIPGFEPNAARSHAESPLKNFIFLIPDRNGRYIQIGTISNTASIMPTEGSTAEAAKKWAGYTFEISNDQDKVLFYEGTVTLNDNTA